MMAVESRSRAVRSRSASAGSARVSTSTTDGGSFATSSTRAVGSEAIPMSLSERSLAITLALCCPPLGSSNATVMVGEAAAFIA